jgi:hypothetical protein
MALKTNKSKKITKRTTYLRIEEPRMLISSGRRQRGRELEQVVAVTGTETMIKADVCLSYVLSLTRNYP